MAISDRKRTHRWFRSSAKFYHVLRSEECQSSHKIRETYFQFYWQFKPWLSLRKMLQWHIYIRTQHTDLKRTLLTSPKLPWLLSVKIDDVPKGQVARYWSVPEGLKRGSIQRARWVVHWKPFRLVLPQIRVQGQYIAHRHSRRSSTVSLDRSQIEYGGGYVGG